MWIATVGSSGQVVATNSDHILSFDTEEVSSLWHIVATLDDSTTRTLNGEWSTNGAAAQAARTVASAIGFFDPNLLSDA